MVQILPTVFCAWEFNEKEEPALIFTDIQIMYLHTELAKIAQEKLEAAVDPGKPIEEYLRAQEYMRGQIEILKYIIQQNELRVQQYLVPLQNPQPKD